ncbi:uncharacterized protein LOC121860941 [Homarus americanus]|uniref:uncharacterized protein LOC121860941 n=1 Tax=Homarus americanus TaxID=6706 RepID=UPI001C487316|nr:uncharacterized protein LOC121860941 [Homarus americanus]XP_042214271.1 uncharacterized protein LOC121860941 [Homarus americanus]XP_042214272.1 uncharacterized protein LOC121860941 [Homarus americanus]
MNYHADDRLLGANKYFKSWYPDPDRPLVSHEIYYHKFYDISYTVHFEDYQQMFHEGSIIPNPIIGKKFSYALEANEQLIQFVVSSTGHNKYGNISLLINLNELLCYLQIQGGFYTYLLEIVEYPSVSVAKLMFSHLQFEDIPKYDASKLGNPWYRDPQGNNYCSFSTRRFQYFGENEYDTELEFHLQLTNGQCKELYNKCRREPVSHYEANLEEPCKCMKYRLGRRDRWQNCPSPWKSKETALKMYELQEEIKPDGKDVI